MFLLLLVSLALFRSSSSATQARLCVHLFLFLVGSALVCAFCLVSRHEVYSVCLSVPVCSLSLSLSPPPPHTHTHTFLTLSDTRTLILSVSLTYIQTQSRVEWISSTRLVCHCSLQGCVFPQRHDQSHRVRKKFRTEDRFQPTVINSLSA